MKCLNIDKSLNVYTAAGCIYAWENKTMDFCDILYVPDIIMQIMFMVKTIAWKTPEKTPRPM